jgi:hypothetical protein
LTVDEKVLRLEVSVDNIQVVEILERQDDLSCVESGVRFAEIWSKIDFGRKLVIKSNGTGLPDGLFSSQKYQFG